MGEMITVNQRIKSVEETQNRDEVKHLRKENSSKTAIIKILSENINHHILILPILPILPFNKTTLHKHQNILIMLLLDHRGNR